jgi:phosphate-selective porin OprO/OprP
MNKTTQILSLSAAILASNSALASTDFSADLKDDFARIWSHATLYKNPDNSVIQKFAFTGRLQGDYAHFENDETGDKYRDSSWRRFRAGIKATAFNNFTIHSEADLNLNDPEPLYNRLTDTYIAWHPTDGWKLKVGKQSAGFTLDGATSSKKLYRMERSLIGGNIWFKNEYFTGVSASGDVDQWQWKAGVFSTDSSPEFDKTFDISYFTLLSAGYDFAEHFDSDKALLRLDYVYQDEADEEDYDNGDVGTAKHEHVVSLSFQYDNGKKHLHTDLAYAKQFNGNKYYAVQIMPLYDLNDTFQIATSYTHIESSDDASLSVTKYAKDLQTGKTESADEFYLGLNTFLYGHKVKWQNGITYTTTDKDEFEGFGFTSGIRISW